MAHRWPSAAKLSVVSERLSKRAQRTAGELADFVGSAALTPVDGSMGRSSTGRLSDALACTCASAEAAVKTRAELNLPIIRTRDHRPLGDRSDVPLAGA